MLATGAGFVGPAEPDGVLDGSPTPAGYLLVAAIFLIEPNVDSESIARLTVTLKTNGC